MTLSPTVALSLALGILGGLACLGCSAAAQQFSADIVTTDAAGRIDRHRGKDLRLERRGSHRDIRPSRRPLSGERQRRHCLFRQAGPANLHGCEAVEPPDPDLRSGRSRRPVQAVAGDGDGRRSRGSGRAVALPSARPGQCRRTQRHKIPGDIATGATNYGWIDPQLEISAQVPVEDGTTIDLDSIREAPQPAELFEIPADFRKFDPQQLIERIKQSDVWVEPPK